MKQKTVFCCSECGGETPNWAGKCPHCGAWNSLREVSQDEKSKSGAKASRTGLHKAPKLLRELESEEELRFPTGISEFDRVLGGGAVRGSLVLVGGAPGIGKSTILLQLCGMIGAHGGSVEALPRDGGGTTIRVTLPLPAEPADPEIPA